ncbi:hypothetical protein [Sphingobium yanoikuyae]|jgi:hypothetical protein|uniref:hypothetical protein n=1 Tax=Sphingobium yanoikuyae TaxID=13690 RepID=UPI0028AEEE99|nr:hypothetical protein [Sphingobium yanoikuyae]
MIREDNIFTPYLNKRMSFEYEREIRAVIWEMSSSVEPARGDGDPLFSWSEFGVNVQVDLENLIDAVYISPTAPSWFSDLVGKIMTRYGLTHPIEHSSLSAMPVY